jgi:hypothetical protein
MIHSPWRFTQLVHHQCSQHRRGKQGTESTGHSTQDEDISIVLIEEINVFSEEISNTTTKVTLQRTQSSVK